MNHDEVRAFLGVSYATAKYRLLRHLLFSLLKNQGKNVCYRCGESIDDRSDLTVDHKVSWFHRNPELFWDLDNVAFSHHSCNSRCRDYSVSKLRGIKRSDEFKKKVSEGLKRYHRRRQE